MSINPSKMRHDLSSVISGLRTAIALSDGKDSIDADGKQLIVLSLKRLEIIYQSLSEKNPGTLDGSHDA